MLESTSGNILRGDQRRFQRRLGTLLLLSTGNFLSDSSRHGYRSAQPVAWTPMIIYCHATRQLLWAEIALLPIHPYFSQSSPKAFTQWGKRMSNIRGNRTLRLISRVEEMCCNLETELISPFSSSYDGCAWLISQLSMCMAFIGQPLLPLIRGVHSLTLTLLLLPFAAFEYFDCDVLHAPNQHPIIDMSIVAVGATKVTSASDFSARIQSVEAV